MLMATTAVANCASSAGTRSVDAPERDHDEAELAGLRQQNRRLDARRSAAR